MIVLNEKEYAEECLKNWYVGEKPFHTLSILGKYYYHHCGYRKAKITDLLTEFMSKHYPRYSCDKAAWDDSIEKIAKNAGKYKLFELDGVWITEAELNTISSIRSKALERLAFTLLCLAKLGNMRNPNNNGWVNYDAKDIFDLARISCGAKERYAKISKLRDLSLVEFPKRNDNLSCRVTYINDNSGKKLFISDFRELGYEYLKYQGENLIRCEECGILTRNNKSGNRKHCDACCQYTPQTYKTIVCVDCGKEFKVSSKNNQSCRCDDCYTTYRRLKVKENVQRYREKRSL